MTIDLAALGWVDDKPRGVRLRWRFPADLVGLPEVLIVERAPVRDWRADHAKPSVAAAVPSSWWSSVGDVHLTGVPPVEYVFPAPVDAVRYTQQRPARVLAVDQTGRVVDDRVVHHGETVEIARPRLRALRFLAFDVTLHDLKLLDLDAVHGLDWKPLAKLRIAAPLHSPFAHVADRVHPNPVDDERWGDLLEIVQRAESDPATWPPGEPTPWQALDTVLGLRWAHAVVAGSGFVDGPGTTEAPVDGVDHDALLKAPPGVAYAYRIVEPNATGRPPEHSTVAVVTPGVAPPLGAPHAPVYAGGTVRLGENGAYEATTSVSWHQTDPLAIGAVLVEEASPSALTGAASTTEPVEVRSRRPEDLPMTGSLVRVRTVPAHDVTISARAIALDGWDRESAPSPAGPSALLDLIHAPPAPQLASGRWNGGTTTLHLAPTPPGGTPWTPDALVTTAGGEVIVCRRTRDPIRAGVTTGVPAPAGDGLLDVPVSGVPAGVTFTGGRLVANGRSLAVVAERPGYITVVAPASGGGPSISLPAGPAILVEDGASPTAWTEVHAVPVTAVPAAITFAEPLPLPASGHDVCAYLLRVGFLGRRGPFGNVVAVPRLVTAPAPPPPFTVELLDVDHLRRTLVEIDLTTPASGEHVVAWARGALSGDAFAVAAAEGDLGPIEPHEGHLLHDVLPLPIPRSIPEIVTIGVAAVGAAATRSAYTTVQVVVPAPA